MDEFYAMQILETNKAKKKKQNKKRAMVTKSRVKKHKDHVRKTHLD